MYDGNGNRYSKKVIASGRAAVSRYYFYDTSGNVVSEYEARSSNKEVRSFTYDANGNTVEVRSSNNEARTFYFIYNSEVTGTKDTGLKLQEQSMIVPTKKTESLSA